MPDPTHQPRYHLHPRSGWMNDPNGAIYYQGHYHLFYQHNPNGAFSASKHWAHVASRDVLRWEEWPVALAPEPGSYDKDGCLSGFAVVHNGTPMLVYTGVKPQVVGGAREPVAGEHRVHRLNRGDQRRRDEREEDDAEQQILEARADRHRREQRARGGVAERAEEQDRRERAEVLPAKAVERGVTARFLVMDALALKELPEVFERPLFPRETCRGRVRPVLGYRALVPVLIVLSFKNE